MNRKYKFANLLN